MPEKLYPGQDVDWYPHGDRNNAPHPAKVLTADAHSADLAVLHPELNHYTHVHGVRHIDAKGVRDEQRVEDGGWDYTPLHKRIADMESRLFTLEQTAGSIFSDEQPATKAAKPAKAL